MLPITRPSIRVEGFKFGRDARKAKILDVEFRGNNERLQYSTLPEIILTGPTRTGKTRSCLHKIWTLASRYPGLRALIIRKQRATLSETALVTLERDVIGLDHLLVIDGPQRDYRKNYKLDNGSTVVVGGLDKPGKILSSEYDIIFVPQAEELDKKDWEYLTTRLAGTALPPEDQQIIGDCNPQGPYHWIYKRSIEGSLNLWETYHRDNPLLWDLELNNWTDFGKAYIDRLRSTLTGTTRDRLLDGKWVQAEGVVYSDFLATEEGNVVFDDPDLDDPTGSFELAFDDGYIDPRAILFVWRTASHVWIFDEIYHTKHLPETCVKEMIERCVVYFGSKLDELLVEDPEATEDLEDAEIEALKKTPQRLPGIAVGSPEAKVLHVHLRRANIAVRYKAIPTVVEALGPVRILIRDGDGYRALKVHSRCTNIIEEMTGGYKYPDKARANEKPLDENNHACDAFRDWAWLRANKK